MLKMELLIVNIVDNLYKPMKDLIEKYTNELKTLKENRAETVDTNTDAENELYDKLIHQTAKFLRDLNNLNN